MSWFVLHNPNGRLTLINMSVLPHSSDRASCSRNEMLYLKLVTYRHSAESLLDRVQMEAQSNSVEPFLLSSITPYCSN